MRRQPRQRLLSRAVPLENPLFGVVGSPIAHSQSPALHRAAYAVIGFEARYDRTEIGDGGLADFLRGAGVERRGLSVTMPLKREAWSIAATRDRAAELTGAVNTLYRSGGDEDAPFAGANTDVGGIVDAVRSGAAREPRHVLVLGGGATASSAVVAAADLGASALTLAVRTPERAEGAARLARSIGLAVDVVTLDRIASIRSDVVVSTLPGGTPLAGLPTAACDDGALLLDAAYAPWPSELVRYWIAGEAPVVHGLSMLVRQAARQVRLFASVDDAEWATVADRTTAAMFDVVGLDRSGIVRSLPDA
ncbi:shikimate dehydrogenase family protein [Labedella phragmitis]|uniref:shikimate dehydrogenase family protein n=1 Tax=Labedella phragmitis TaxID=2498849 RepID=UPI0014087177|nr:shikimate dehydrogenase [Labedella phragmitis]